MTPGPDSSVSRESLRQPADIEPTRWCRWCFRLVSVGPLFEEALSSALGQTWSRLEVLIVDDRAGTIWLVSTGQRSRGAIRGSPFWSRRLQV